MLHGESSTLLEALEGSGEVARLRQLDHLGAVRLAIEGAHHPRWEYVVTTLALISRARFATGIALSATVNAAGVRFSSGSELLSCWSLLLNTGHLKWTFAAERVLLQELWANKAATTAFEGSISATSKATLRSVLRRGDAYRLYPLLAAYRLPLTVGGLVAPWVAAIDAYVRPSSEQLRRLRRLFQGLRRIAYLALDTTYAPSHVRLSLSQLLTDAAAFRRLAVGASDVDEAELAGLDAFMSRQIYLSEPVLRMVAERDFDLRHRIRDGLKGLGLAGTVESLARGTIQDESDREALGTIVRSNLRMEPPFEWFRSAVLNPRHEEARISRRVRDRGARAVVSIWPVLGASEWIIQLHTPGRHTPFNAAVITAFAEWVDSRRQQLVGELTRPRAPELRDHEFAQSAGLDAVARDLILDALRVAFSKEVRWEWAQAGWAGAAGIAPGSVAKALIGLELRRLRGAAPERRAELRLLQRAISKRDAVVAVGIARLQGFDMSTDKTVVEFDGLYFREKGRALELTFVEAKLGRAGRTAAKKQLEAAIRTLRPVVGVTVSEPIILAPLKGEPRGSRAIARVTIPYP